MSAMMKTKLSDKKKNCLFCGKEDFHAYCIENNGEILPYCGYCRSCGKCITPLEYQFAQDQIIADYSMDYSSRALKNAGVKHDEDAPVKMLEKKYITAGLKYNNLFNYLITKFDRTKVKEICNIYGLATHKVGNWDGASIFYQYNKDDQCQAVKIIQYDKETGHRITGDDKKDEAKDLLYQKPLIEKGKYCLFGRHLLNRPDSDGKPICIVESEKTAIIASIVYPEAIWMAAGSCYYLYDSKIDKEMRDRKIVLFPDVDVKYESIDIDEDTGNRRCINWYLINTRPHGFGLTNNNNTISVSGFLESFLAAKCKKCPHNHKTFCSSSPYYSLENGNEPYRIENRKMGFKLNAYPDIAEIPKVVLDKLTEVRCEFRGWDLGDYIVWCKQNDNDLVSFGELISPINQDRIGEIQKITSSFEEKLNYMWWQKAVRQGITELPKDQKDNTKK